MTRYLKRLLPIGIALLGIVYYVLDPGQHILFPQCLFYTATGYFCPGCGSQRAIHGLLHLDIAGVADSNFLFIPAVLAIGYHYCHKPLNNTFKLSLPNIFYMKYTPWIILGIVVLFWITRNLTVFPFSLLAP